MKKLKLGTLTIHKPEEWDKEIVEISISNYDYDSTKLDLKQLEELKNFINEILLDAKNEYLISIPDEYETLFEKLEYIKHLNDMYQLSDNMDMEYGSRLHKTKEKIIIQINGENKSKIS